MHLFEQYMKTNEFAKDTYYKLACILLIFIECNYHRPKNQNMNPFTYNKIMTKNTNVIIPLFCTVYLNE